VRAYVLTFGQVDPGIGVTLWRESAEPLREDTGDELSLVMAPLSTKIHSCVAVGLYRYFPMNEISCLLAGRLCKCLRRADRAVVSNSRAMLHC
jgi:hypothetical protein